MAFQGGLSNSNADCFRILSEFSEEHSPLVRLAHRLGPVQFNLVLEELGGNKIHVPTPESFWSGLDREHRNEVMRAQFNGRNYAELAQWSGLSERAVRKIVHEKR